MAPCSLQWRSIPVKSVVVGFPDGGAIVPQYELVPNVFHVEVHKVIENEMCLNSEPNSLNHTNLKKDKTNTYAPCNLNHDIEKGKTEFPKSTEESIGYSKSDDSSACLRLILTNNCLIEDIAKRHLRSVRREIHAALDEPKP
ncbi:hypothetical protein DH2020_040444 [Rehmannia glutinosa]|uniref:Uncharacterized protein n=1 Tax=Rehmannia glutinosa TaxID=99300 RepID=A0ABR0UUP9_REHGL